LPKIRAEVMRENDLTPSLSLKTVVGPTVDQRAEPVPEIQRDGDPKGKQNGSMYKKYKTYKVSRFGMIGSENIY
jgi:hypothetical protein